MGSPADLTLAGLLVLGALAYAVYRFGFSRKPPECAPDGKAPPQVILGGKLASGLSKAKKKR